MVKTVDTLGPAVLETARPLPFLPAESAGDQEGRPFVAIVRTKDAFLRFLQSSPAGLQWLQVENLLSDSDAWVHAAHGDSAVALDVLLAAPAREFSDLYRLVDACAVRNIRVSIPASPGFSKAVRVAAALKLPVRLLPGQPNSEVIRELRDTLDFYLRDPMVEAPVEFFHSVLAFLCGAEIGSLWMILEEDPGIFQHQALDGNPKLPRRPVLPSSQESTATFVEDHFKKLVKNNAECVACSWQNICQGYFKWPESTYDCQGVKQLFSDIKEAAEEMVLALSRQHPAHSNDEIQSADDNPFLPSGRGE
jgi:hypothetical protein